MQLQALSDVTSREIHVYKIERGPHGNVLIVNPGDTTTFKPQAAAAATAAEEAGPLRLVLAVGMHYGALLTEDKIATAGLHEYVPQATPTRVADVDIVRWQEDIVTKRQTDARERGDQDEARRLGWVLVDLDAIRSAILENQVSYPTKLSKYARPHIRAPIFVVAPQYGYGVAASSQSLPSAAVASAPATPFRIRFGGFRLRGRTEEHSEAPVHQ